MRSHATAASTFRELWACAQEDSRRLVSVPSSCGCLPAHALAARYLTNPRLVLVSSPGVEDPDIENFKHFKLFEQIHQPTTPFPLLLVEFPFSFYFNVLNYLYLLFD